MHKHQNSTYCLHLPLWQADPPTWSEQCWRTPSDVVPGGACAGWTCCSAAGAGCGCTGSTRSQPATADQNEPWSTLNANQPNTQHTHRRTLGYNNNNNTHANVYGAVVMTMVTARVHPVHLMNADWAPGGHQPTDDGRLVHCWSLLVKLITSHNHQIIISNIISHDRAQISTIYEYEQIISQAH